jgi:hypothetical protein
MHLLNQVGGNPWAHCRYYIRETCLALARFALPGYGSVYSNPRPVIRMLALARVSYSLGVLWGLGTLAKHAGENTQCASA